MATLQCGHTFHENCLMDYLGPISYPSLHLGLDPVTAALERCSETVQLVCQLPRYSEIRAKLRDMVLTGSSSQSVKATFSKAVDEALDIGDELDEDEIEEKFKADGYAQRISQVKTDMDRFTQTLHPLNQSMDEECMVSEVYITDVRDGPRSSGCPYCRQLADLGDLNNHADNVQLIRARFRLTNLAYQCLNFSLTSQEKRQRMQIEQFLYRRYHDNNILEIEDVEDWTASNRGQHLFKQARFSLRENAFWYSADNELNKAERTRIAQLTTFFESFKLKFRDQEFFFGTCSTLDRQWDFDFDDDEYRYLSRDPAGYWHAMEIFIHKDDTIEDGPPSVRIRRAGEYDTTLMSDPETQDGIFN
ncbi:MAG: hypothetical protein Q9169_004886 [Polycauliona sp. 2 TL-2023]